MKTFISIGTGPGIGLATAERFGQEGYRVILAARSSEKVNAMAGALRAKGIEAFAVTVDAAQPDSIARLLAEVEVSYGSIDVLHYNAAIMREATLADQPVDTFNSDLAVNIGGALSASKIALCTMSSRGEGTILLTGGIFAMNPNPDYLSLSIGKAGIRALTLGMYESAREQNIHMATVTVAAYVQPGSPEAAGIADAFWSLHIQAKEEWIAEVVYKG